MAMVLIDIPMPRRCDECPFLLQVKNCCAYCMASRKQIKYSETDLKDFFCPLKGVQE